MRCRLEVLEPIALLSIDCEFNILFGSPAMQRRSNWTPAIVSNRGDRTDGEKKVGVAGGIVAGPALPALNDALLLVDLDNADESSEDTSKVFDRKIRSPADLRFAIGIAFALALPVLVGVGVYVATAALLKAI